MPRRMMIRSFGWIAIASLTVLGCGGPEGVVDEAVEDPSEVDALDAAGKADAWSARVIVTTDKAQYGIQDSIGVTVKNTFLVTSIYLPGCNGTTLQKFENAAWKDLGPEKLCLWEGYAQRVKPQTSTDDLYGPKVAGKYRVRVAFKTGCAKNQTYSQCMRMERISLSPSFTVKAAGSCTQDADCQTGAFCQFKPGECRLPTFNLLQGTCTPTPQACIEIYGPVCGCNNKSYDNECFATAARTSVAAKGLCDTDCPHLAPPGPGFCPGGTIQGVRDPVTQCITSFKCIPSCPPIAPPGPGFCPNGTTRPNVDPLTGCVTGYTCECRPVMCELYCPSGFEKDSFGCEVCKCAPAPQDCRQSGCPSGKYCTFCWTAFMCIPNGAMC
jgi:hypothetical protein